MLSRIELTLMAKAFGRERTAVNQKVLVDEYDGVYVFDAVAGHYTLNHVMSRTKVKDARRIAQRRRK